MKISKKIIQTAVTFAAVLFIVAVTGFSGGLNWLEDFTYDHRMRVTAPYCSPSDRIGVVLLDQDSLNWGYSHMGWSWPWPREAYGLMVDYFNRAGAASVAFDMIYSEPSLYGPEDDKAFAEACRRYGKVILAVHTKAEDDQLSAQNTRPVPVLEESCALAANVTGLADSDGVFRREPQELFGSPTLSFAGLVLNDEVPERIRESSKGAINIRYLDGIERYVPYKAMSILKSELAIKEALAQKKDLQELSTDSDFIAPEQFAGNYVFFGLYAPGLFDICSTPVSANYQGVGVHISLLDTVLQENWLIESPAGFTVLISLAFALAGFAFGSWLLQKKLPFVAVRTLIVVAAGLLYVLISYAAFYKGAVLPVTLPVVSLVLSFIVFVFEDYVTEGHQKKYLKAAFSQYLSPAVINQLIADPQKLQLGGEEKEITAYFSDVQGFTTISENLSPSQLTVVLNRYLSAMTDIILSYGGTIDKYEGDAIIAFWGAPVNQKDHAKRAVEAALACQEKLAQINPELEALSGKSFKQRIGLNTGPAVVGNMGSSQRFDYTMMGDTVNLASRLEGINKQFATYTMCSKSTMDSAVANGCQCSFRGVGNIAVVGKKTGVKVFVPMPEAEYKAQEEIRTAFEKALTLFEKGSFAEAKEAFAKIQDDGPSQKYVEKCEALIKNPPEAWDGIIRATEK